MKVKQLERPFLVGDRVYLRPLDLDDINREYLNWINDSEVIDQLAAVFPTPFYKLESYVKSILDSTNYSFFAIIEKKSNKHIGNVKLGPINWIHRTSNFGLMLGDKGSWGKGYAQESFVLLVKYAFEKLNLHKLWDLAVSSNVPSIKALQKVDFIIEAEMKEHVFKNGKYVDVVVLSLLAENYFIKQKNRPDGSKKESRHMTLRSVRSRARTVKAR